MCCRSCLNRLLAARGSARGGAYATFLSVARANDLQQGVFTLSFKVRETADGRVSVSDFEWWAPYVRTRSRAKESGGYPYVWFPRHRRIPYGTRPPFNAKDTRFRQALSEVIGESGGLDWLERTSLKPSKTFLGRLERRYHALRP